MSEHAQSIQVIELSPKLLSVGAGLLATYKARWSDQGLEECELALRRLLGFPGAHFVLARQAEQYCGFISLHWGFSTTKGMPILRVQDLFVLPEHRRKGVARALLDHSAKLAHERGATRLQLETDTANLAARNLYASFGFEWLSQKEIYMLFLQG